MATVRWLVGLDDQANISDPKSRIANETAGRPPRPTTDLLSSLSRLDGRAPKAHRDLGRPLIPQGKGPI